MHLLDRHSADPSTDAPKDPCAGDPIGTLKKLFVTDTQLARIVQGQCPARRAVFLKPHGCAYGTLSPVADLPDSLRVGVFTRDWPVWVRFSSDTKPGMTDVASTLGVAIKLFGVPGKKLLPGEEDATTQDFIFQNIDVFFVDDVQEMCVFTWTGLEGGGYQKYLDSHPTTARILKEMAKKVPSVVTETYWSGLPYRFGPDRYVKYKLEPRAHDGGDVPSNNPDYLADDLKARLLRGDVTFDFCVQFRTDPDKMPLDKATVPWSEKDSDPVHIATLTLPSQDVDAPGQLAYGQNLSFNPWHSIAEHEPVGSLSDARKVVYQASGATRRFHNGVPQDEPTTPRGEAPDA